MSILGMFTTRNLKTQSASTAPTESAHQPLHTRQEPTVDDIMSLPVMNEQVPGNPPPAVEFLDSLLKNPKITKPIVSSILKILAVTAMFAGVTNPISSGIFYSNCSHTWKQFLVQLVVFAVFYVILTVSWKNE